MLMSYKQSTPTAPLGRLAKQSAAPSARTALLVASLTRARTALPDMLSVLLMGLPTLLDRASKCISGRMEDEESGTLFGGVVADCIIAKRHA
jgi:hypothetical protein